ncbi:MAG: S8 family serine peptidase [Eubacterium sp.]|nr:S8 family serine peptidase [Eubacterium sp.]
MKMKEIAKKLCVAITVTAVVMYYSGFGINAEFCKGASAKKPLAGQEYIIRTKTKGPLAKIKKNYSESNNINDNKQDLLEENNMISLELSQTEVKELSVDDNIEFVEEDAMVEASTQNNKIILNEKKPHKKQEKVNKKNSSGHEWNVQMINADKIKKNKLKRKIKIALLDSGVDAGNDISLAYSISLVPGEEEMTKIFMDGSGHGSSVASLIAAEDNGEGITGINPNAEIYSIRVLDDANQAPLSRVIEGIYLAIEQKVNIINMSFGLNTYSKALEEAVEAASEEGILIVAAAGNTGDNGVQYPAAYDEVLAVGSVDKQGEVTEHSAKGEEIEIVAPGELVRTTGFLGTEMVSSGTSLAAPQVAAAASLIWERDPSASADFVRDLLKESANLYGEAESYGSGLVDAEYALDHYDEFKKNTNSRGKSEQDLRIEENKEKITTFEDTGCVEGCWYGNNHANMVSAGYFNVREGARFPDTDKYIDKDTYVFKRMSINPWWHGYYKYTNYIKAVIYATRMGDAIYYYGKGNQIKASNPNYNNATVMLSDIKYMDNHNVWANELIRIKDINKNNEKAQAQKETVGFRRAFIWGMAIHAATDTYAHSVRYQGKLITHSTKVNGVERADSTEVCRNRYKDAQKIASQIMERYINKQSLSVNDLILPQAPTDYQIFNLYKNVASMDLNAASRVSSYSYSSSSK